MAKHSKNIDKLFDSLEERAKELNCLYSVEKILLSTGDSLENILLKIAKVIPSGMQYPEICKVKIVYQEIEYPINKFRETRWFISEDITVQDRVIGWIKVYYSKEKPIRDDGPFLNEEKRVISSIAQRIGHFVMYQKMRLVFDKMESTREVISKSRTGDWQAALDLLGRSDPDILNRVSRKMLNYLVWKGYPESEQLLIKFIPLLRYGQHDILGESNSPLQQRATDDTERLNQEVFEIAGQHMNDSEIMLNIQEWVKQDKTSFLIRTVSSINSSLTDIADAIRRYYKIAPQGMELAPSTRIGVRAALIRRFFTDQLEFVNIAKNYVRVSDFRYLIQHMISPSGSHGKLGGKSAGLFLASRILEENKEHEELLRNFKVPKGWYLTSDTMLQFMNYNNLEDMLEQKYKPI
ncbi:MAG: pyruvate, phosphate dikinase, partial [Calditrichae bacterium]|nr:pyruvate, phosphate dikinase [Calditrichia bacterium]